MPGPSTIGYGGNTTCVEVRTDGEIIILDAGSGIRELGLSLEKEFDGAPINLTLLLTHTHWDHIQGLPFFLPAYKAKNSLRVLGFEGARAGLAGAELRAEGFVCSVERASVVLGFTAEVSLAEGLEQTVRWYRERGWI